MYIMSFGGVCFLIATLLVIFNITPFTITMIVGFVLLIFCNLYGIVYNN